MPREEDLRYMPDLPPHKGLFFRSRRELSEGGIELTIGEIRSIKEYLDKPKKMGNLRLLGERVFGNDLLSFIVTELELYFSKNKEIICKFGSTDLKITLDQERLDQRENTLRVQINCS
jgi:hypothetical protein